jgi:polyisoprenoid-binding protein YceI
MTRTRLLLIVAAIPIFAVAGFGLYLLSLGGYLPGQTDPTPIGASITPFADLALDSGSPPATISAPGSTPVGPGASPLAWPPGATIFVIAGDQSLVRYVVQEELAGFPGPTIAIGETRAIIGEFALDATGRPISGSTFQADLRTLKSDKVRRDNDVKRFFLETDDFPIATFVISEVDGLDAPLPKGQPVSFKIIGELTAHGVTETVIWDATVTLNGNTLTGTATTTFLFADFGMKVPNIAGMVSAEDPIRLEIEITALKQS